MSLVRQARATLGRARPRLVLMTFLAVIPIGTVAGLITWQDFRATEGRVVGRLNYLRGVEEGGRAIAIEALQPVLAAASATVASAAAPAGNCDALDKLLPGNADRFSAFAIVRSGAVACSTSQSFAALLHPAPVWPSASNADRLLLSAASGENKTTEAIATYDGGQGFLIAALLQPLYLTQRLQRPRADEEAVWLYDSEARVLWFSGSADAAPTPAELPQLMHQEGVRALSAAGVPFIYAASPWQNGTRLLIAYRGVSEERKAQTQLWLRVFELAALMLAGMLTILAGAEVAFGRPLRVLRDAVIRWHGTGDFPSGRIQGAPAELQELADSFAAATTALRERQERLAQAQAAQDLLMKEIHHRVKNNLQIVASLLNLQASRIRVPAARAEFQSARDRVRALATLHRHLYAYGEIHTINMRSFLTELCGQLFQAIGEREGERIALSISAPEVRMTSDQAVPLALIVTEAVTNSIKYAFPEGRRGHVSVTLEEHDDRLQLVIEDDGVGLPLGWAETETGVRDGIGLQLIRGFARQLGAALTVQEERGTRYVVQVPLNATGTSGPRLAALREA